MLLRQRCLVENESQEYGNWETEEYKTNANILGKYWLKTITHTIKDNKIWGRNFIHVKDDYLEGSMVPKERSNQQWQPMNHNENQYGHNNSKGEYGHENIGGNQQFSHRT